jgi:hypothetical protein
LPTRAWQLKETFYALELWAFYSTGTALVDVTTSSVFYQNNNTFFGSTNVELVFNQHVLTEYAYNTGMGASAT